MNNEQRNIILQGVKAGVDTKKIAETVGVPEVDVKILITWWRDRNSPENPFS